MAKPKITKTPRGFSIAKFNDRYGQQCSIQKSSLATEDAIWLGVDVGFKPDHLKASPAESNGPTFVMNARMHLTQSMVKHLLPMLTKFAKTGGL